MTKMKLKYQHLPILREITYIVPIISYLGP